MKGFISLAIATLVALSAVPSTGQVSLPEAQLYEKLLEGQKQQKQEPPTSAPQPARAPGQRVIRPMGGDIILNPGQVQEPRASEALPEEVSGAAKPFGWELFRGSAAIARARGANPAYVISPGDKIAVQVWGAKSAEYVVTVDLQGNLFIPEVGPVSVAGIPQSELNSRIARTVARIYTNRVRVYTNLLNTQPIGVYVTGAVNKPGRYAGERTDSLLYYIGQAGGIDLKRGSFRDIRLLRGGRKIEQIDLYRFLLRGELPTPQLRNNDTLVIGPLRATLTVGGAVRNAYIFEISPGGATGEAVISMAEPLPDVSHVQIRGVRAGRPYNAYITIEQFRSARLADGDTLVFQSDMVGDTIFVTVSGQESGPSSFAVPRGTMLSQVLDIVAVDPNTANTAAIYLKRKSVALKQKQALQRALDQLQREVLTASSTTTSEATIRAAEATRISGYIERARSAVPEGRVVLNGNARAIRLEADDEIVIPQRSALVTVSGEVRLPQSVAYQPGRGIEYYVEQSGGFSSRADTDEFVVIHQSGAVETGGSPRLQPGDQVIVLPSAGNKAFAITKDIIEVLARVILSTGVIINILDKS